MVDDLAPPAWLDDAPPVTGPADYGRETSSDDLGAAAGRRGNGLGGRRRGNSANPPPVITGFATLRRMEFPPIRFVVPGYLAEGCTLLAGRPKLGKSWLALDWAIAVARGGHAMGSIECDEGDVLALLLEDNLRRVQRRADKLIGPYGQWPTRLDVATEWPRLDCDGIKYLTKWIEGKPNPRLIVVDVLAMVKPVGDSQTPAYEADYSAVKALQSVASKYNLAILVVHHTRKAGSESGDPFEKVSGTLGLSGAADAVIVLDRDSNGATLYGRGRDVEEIEVAVQFDRATAKWMVIGAVTEVRRTDERTVILNVLLEADEPMSPTEIAGALGVSSNNIKQLLFKMVKAGEVVKTRGRGKYVHPDKVMGAEPVSPHNHDNQDNQDPWADDD